MAKEIQKISLLSLAGSIAVAAIHIRWPLNNGGDVSGILLFGAITRTAVPLFFAISGYFLSGHVYERGWWRKEVFKRIMTLALPYVIWLGVYEVIAIVTTGHSAGGLKGVGWDLTRSPTFVPLWYLRCLFILIFLSPIIVAMVNRLRYYTLAIFYALYLGYMFGGMAGWIKDVEIGGIGGFLTYGISLEGLFFFAAGLCYGMKPFSLAQRHLKIIPLVLAACCVAVQILLFKCGYLVWVVMPAFIRPLLAVGALLNTPEIKLPNFLRGVAFPIYLMHALVYAIVRNCAGIAYTTNPWLELALGVVIPIVFYRLMKRFAPTPTKFIFGGR